MKKRTIGLYVAAAGMAGAAPGVCRAQFVAGELYLVNAELADPGGGCNAPGIMHLVPQAGVTWSTTLLASLPATLSGRGAYDPFRQRIVVGYTDASVELVSSTGGRAGLPSPGTASPLLFAPTGDGRIYVYVTGAIKYYDSANALHTLMDIGGATPYVPPTFVGAMIYDTGTNSIVLAAGTAPDSITIYKIGVNGAGTAVQGAVVSVTFNAAGVSGELPVAFSRGPSGTLFLKIDDNSNGTAARMQLFNPSTLGIQPFAYSGYQGVGGETAGIYVPSLSKAVVLDTLNNELRTFAQNDTGQGMTIAASGVSSNCGSGDTAQFVLIESFGSSCYANCDGSTASPVLNVLDFTCFLQKFAASDSYANCDHSTAAPTLNVLDFTCFLQKFAAGCP